MKSGIRPQPLEKSQQINKRRGTFIPDSRVVSFHSVQPFLFINLCFDYIFSYFGPGLGSWMLLGTIAVCNIIIHGKIEAYHDNNVQVESKWHERLLSLLNSFYSMSTVLACYLFWAYDSTLLIFFGSCFLYLYVGIIVPSTAILKNPLMKSYIRGRFPEIPELVVVID